MQNIETRILAEQCRRYEFTSRYSIFHPIRTAADMGHVSEIDKYIHRLRMELLETK